MKSKPASGVIPRDQWTFAPLTPMQQRRIQQQRRELFGDAPVIRPRSPQ